MKKAIVSLWVASLSLYFIMPAPKSQLIRADVNINSIAAEKPAPPDSVKQSASTGSLSVRLALAEEIGLDFLPAGAYLGTVKFDASGTMYLVVYQPGGQMELIRFNPERSDHQAIVLPADASLIAFDVGRKGEIYVAVSYPVRRGAILTLNPDGSVRSKIDTNAFLAANIAVDAGGRIWTAGQAFVASLTDSYLYDVQIRIYDAQGNLLRVPAGGLDVNDPTMSVFTVDESEVKFIRHTHCTQYGFSETRVSSAHAYPFVVATDLARSRQEVIPGEPQRLIKGVGQVGANKVWYGNVKNTDGSYGKSLIGITNMGGVALTPEIELTERYRSLAGIDPQGNLYAYSKAGEQVVLEKLKLIVENQ